MAFDLVALGTTANRVFASRGVSAASRRSIFEFTESSADALWKLLVPEADSPHEVPNDHWSRNCDRFGPSYHWYSVSADDDWEQRWEDDAISFFESGFSFGRAEDVVIANSRNVYLAQWRVFLNCLHAFRPWHDVTFVVKQDSSEFAMLVEDYHSVAKGTRPWIAGFDSTSCCDAWDE